MPRQVLLLDVSADHVGVAAVPGTPGLAKGSRLGATFETATRSRDGSNEQLRAALVHGSFSGQDVVGRRSK